MALKGYLSHEDMSFLCAKWTFMICCFSYDMDSGSVTTLSNSVPVKVAPVKDTPSPAL